MRPAPVSAVSSRRGAFLLALLAGTVTVPASAPATPDASSPSVVCARITRTFEIGFGKWGGAGTGTKNEFFALAGGDGANRPGGYLNYGLATPTRADTDASCRRATLRPNPSRRRLSKPFRYRETSNGNVYFMGGGGRQLVADRLWWGTIDATDRDSYGVRFRCASGGRFAVFITDSRDRAGRVVGSYFSVRFRRELLATAVLREQGESFFRISSRCEQQ
jgi:hypothetical protein